jgi:hypothetical protein
MMGFMPDVNSPLPTSIRFRPDELALIDAWCAYYSEDRGFKHSRSDLLRNLLKKVPPPVEKAGESELALPVRVAWGTVFARTPKPEEQS